MIEVEKENGTVHYLEEESIKVIDFIIDSPWSEIESVRLDGVDGYVDHGTTYERRKMILILKTDNNFFVDRRKVNKIFDSKQSFYLTDANEPERRWRCKVEGGYTPERSGKNRTIFNIPLVSDFTYAESILSTLESDKEKYTFDTDNFIVINNGDTTVDPRTIKTPLTIRFEGVSDKLEIKNLTTGDIWTYEGKTDADDVIAIEGVQSLKNNKSIFRDTNYKLIKLIEGTNEFELKGTRGDFKISFDFHKYTL